MLRYKSLLLLILALAFLVRVSTLRYALPFSYQEQEQRIVNIALKIGGTGDLDPHFFGKGILWYVLVAEFGAYYLLGRATGMFAGTFDFAKSYFLDHTPFYVIDRLNQLAIAMLSLWFLYRLAKRILGDFGGIWALAIGAACAYHVEASRYALVDMLNALFGVLCLLHLHEYDETKRFKNFFWAAVFAGLSASAKLNGGIFLVGMMGLLIIRKEAGKAVLGCVIFTAAFVISTPAIFLSPAESYQSFREEAYIRYVLDKQTYVGISQWAAFKTFVLSGLTIPGAVLFLAGFRQSMGSRAFKWIGMVFPGILYFFWLGRMFPEPHYLLVIWPILSLLMAAGVIWISERRWARSGILTGLLVIFSQIFYLPGSPHPSVMAATEEYLKPVPAHRMIVWIQKNIPRGARIAAMAPGTWKGRLFPVPEELRERIDRFKNIPVKFSIDYNAGNEQMYQWILKIVETDTAVPAYRFVNLDVQTEAEQKELVRRSNLVWIENLLAFEKWREVDRIDADYFLFVDGMDKPDGRISQVGERLKTRELAAAFAPFYLYKMN